MADANGQDLTLNSSCPSSRDDSQFTTGMSFQDAMHSTPLRGPAQSPRFHGYAGPSVHDSDQEPERSMSIEMGRGVKRGARDDFAGDHSSNVALSFAHDKSMSFVVDTPPSRPRPSQRRSDGPLRKEASVRRATESAKAIDALKKSTNAAKPRAVSDNVQSYQGAGSPQHTTNINVNVRGSRFTASRQVSSHAASIPTRFTSHGGLEFSNQTATAISATYNASQTNQSFLLPDLPNINELVLGVRRDGTPTVKRASRSRFTSASHNPPSLSHLPVTGVAVPDDEKAIYASLQILRDRLTQLEVENSEAQKRAEQYEAEAINLRSQANFSTRRPDSGLGSDDDTIGPEKSKLQSSLQALQDHVGRYERKINSLDIAVGRVTMERDSLITQVGQAYLKHEKLAEENEAFRETQANLVAENEGLREEVNGLRNENLHIREQLESMRAFQSKETGDQRRKSSTAKSPGATKAGREEMEDIAGGPWNFTATKTNGETMRNWDGGPTATYRSQNARERTKEPQEATSARDMALRIEQEIQKLREEAASGKRRSKQEHPPRSGSVNSTSRSQRRHDNEHVTSRSSRGRFSAPAGASNTEAMMSARENDAAVSSQEYSAIRAAETNQVERDLTELSELDFNLAANLRKKLEEERRSKRASRGQTQTIELDHTGRSVTRQSIPRKSSMKDMTAGVEEGTGRYSIGGRNIEELIKTAKIVRVQSPHSSDAALQPQQPDVTETGDVSVVSNISRRRRRTGSTEGMTSAFIIPDITIHGNQTSDVGKTCIRHNAASCTACSSTGAEVEIPIPVPVTDRELEDVTNATIRPAQPPAEALATVIKNLEDEVTHLKMQKEVQNQAYNQHDPALSKHRRLAVKAELGRLMALIEKRSDQIYALYDVLEGQKQQNSSLSQEGDESLEVGRSAPADRADESEFSGMESDELPWEGLSEAESDE